MANKIVTLHDTDLEGHVGVDNLLPRTRVKAVFDKNGHYLSDNLTAEDLNALVGLITEDDVAQIVKITTQGTTLGQINTMLNEINTAGKHVFFDVASLGAKMYLCTISIDTVANTYTIFVS